MNLPLTKTFISLTIIIFRNFLTPSKCPIHLYNIHHNGYFLHPSCKFKNVQSVFGYSIDKPIKRSLVTLKFSRKLVLNGIGDERSVTWLSWFRSLLSAHKVLFLIPLRFGHAIKNRFKERLNIFLCCSKRGRGRGCWEKQKIMLITPLPHPAYSAVGR